jgi:hypothetical protein
MDVRFWISALTGYSS